MTEPTAQFLACSIHLGDVLQATNSGMQLHTDAALVVAQGGVAAVLPRREALGRYPNAEITRHNGLIAPGFVDLHIHYPQTDVIASPADGLLSWLEEYTFPQEAKFADSQHAQRVASVFFDELARNGVTTALTFCTSHVTSVDAFFEQAQARGLRMIGGKCLMDRNCPEAVRDGSKQGLRDTEALIQKWHGKDRLGYAITPRFACTSTPEQLHGAGELAAAHPSVWVQSHVSENLDEIEWALELFPDADTYLDVYRRAGLLRDRSIYAHCIHFGDADRSIMREHGASAAVCPTSNLFLGSGHFDFALADRQGMAHGLASDVGGGMSFSPFATMRAAYTVGRSDAQTAGLAKPALSLSAQKLWWLHTAGAAQCLGLEGQIGSLQPGTEADFVVIDCQATPLLKRKTEQAQSLEELLFALIVLADDRAISATYAQGRRLESKQQTENVQ